MTIIDKFLNIDFNENSLLLDKVIDMHYDITPIGAKIFASMGVDGVHYCIVPKNGDVTLENSPVYRISPMDFSEGAIIWAAKNIYDFMGISITLKDFWILPCLIGLSEKEFSENIKISEIEFNEKADIEKSEIIKSVNLLKKVFSAINVKNLYQYIHESYSDKNNHVKLEFSIPDIVEIKHGFYDFTG